MSDSAVAGPAAPLVTIIICTRNRGSRLHLVLDALARIESRLAWDVLMVDNASTDNTAEVIQVFDKLGPRLTYACATQIGLGAARDFAWRLAKGQILAFTDDDCYPAPDFVDAVAGAFAANPDAGLIGGRILLFDPSDVDMAIDTRSEPKDIAPFSYLETGSYHGANMAVRKSALEKAGGFDPGLGAGTPFPCEDIDVAAAISWAGYVTRFDPAPVVYHHHGRKQVDLDKLWRGYDAGRGAYYAKYLMRKDTRNAFLAGWGKRLLKHSSRWHMIQFMRELKAARQYARSRQAKTATATPLAYAALVLVSLVAIAQRMRLILGGRLAAKS